MTASDNRSGSAWIMLLAIGIIAVILGLIVIFNPFDSVRFLTVMTGVAFLIGGILGIVASVRGTSRINMAAPIVALIGGLVLILIPEGSVKTAAIVVGVILMAIGIVAVVLGIGGREASGWGPVMAGVVVALIGLIVIVWPGPTLALLAILAGISIVLFGIGSIGQAFKMRG